MIREKIMLMVNLDKTNKKLVTLTQKLVGSYHMNQL